MLNLVENQTIVLAVVIVGMLINLINVPASIVNGAKRFMGVIWIGLAAFAQYSLLSEGIKKMSAATGGAGQQTIIQWSIILIIFTIVMVGLLIYGIYCLRGEYTNDEGLLGINKISSFQPVSQQAVAVEGNRTTRIILMIVAVAAVVGIIMWALNNLATAGEVSGGH